MAVSPNTDWIADHCERTKYDVPGIALPFVFIYRYFGTVKTKVFIIKLKCK